ncbi:MAG: hypothetical protein OXT72_01490 [Gammaproteobacteria bacterium]|nr:hypothetical protein [Gammaproteobacteria bacterium]MDE0246821.1 hypothetical protein [Gammaproteobacteria bacterium]
MDSAVLRATRGRDLLPIEEMRYYSDRFALAEDTYSDRIRVGDGTRRPPRTPSTQ